MRKIQRRRRTNPPFTNQSKIQRKVSFLGNIVYHRVAKIRFSFVDENTTKRSDLEDTYDTLPGLQDPL